MRNKESLRTLHVHVKKYHFLIFYLSLLAMGNGKMPSCIAFCSGEFSHNDQQQVFRNLQRHSQKSCFPMLAKFLSECINVLKTEIQLLPWRQRSQIPNFQSLLSLASLVLSDNNSSPSFSCVPLEATLLCASQIALTIGYFEAENIRYNLHQQNVAALGLEGGLFTAIAISVSESLSDLVFIGSECVRAAFRFQIHVDRVSQTIESRVVAENIKVWGYTLTGASEALVQQELNHFNRLMTSSPFTNIRISNIGNNHVSVTGIPSRVKFFLQSSGSLHEFERTPMLIRSGLYPAPDIYSHEDIKIITETPSRQAWEKLSVHIPVLSPSTGAPLCANNAFHLLELVCEELLTKSHNQINLIKNIPICLSSPDFNDDELRVLSYGESIYQNRFFSEIKTRISTVKVIEQNLTSWILKNLDEKTSVSDYSKLAVVGMSCRMPGGANNPELLFQLLADGRDVHTKIPSDRFDVETHFDPTGITENASETPFGNFIDDPGLFDASFFNMSPHEAEQTDPMHRIALMTAYEALEMSGFSPNRTLSTNLKRVGTSFGVASDDYREVNASQNIGTHATPGGERAFANGRINYFFKFGGPSLNIDTACSSSGAAIDVACSLLWTGQVDMMIAGGLNVITNPDNYCMLSKGHFLSKTGQCKVWSKDADGYCRADGIGCIVIKRLEDAIAENDNILATILASSTNHSAEAVSITHPHVGAQMDNYNLILHRTGLNPLDVSYVELHGTGTQAGDGVESKSVANVFAPLGPARNPNNPLYLGAIKSNIGHGEAAAGVASLIKVLLAFQKELIPRNIGIGNEMNPLVAANIHNRNIQMVTENTSWPKVIGKKRYAIANSFGAHGGNSTFLLEDAPTKAKIGHDPRKIYPIVISAKGSVSLKGNIMSLINYLNRNTDIIIGDLSYTLCARRMHHHTRVGTSVNNLVELKRFLLSSAENMKNLRPIPSKPVPIAFVFTGQGVIYEGVAGHLFNSYPPFSKDILRLDKASQQMGFPSIIPFIKKSIQLKDTPPIVTQLSVLIIEIALIKFWEYLGIVPDIVIGHSLGEYAALVAAGVLSATDAIFLVGKRAEIILDTCAIGSHSMLSICASVEVIRKIANGLPFEITCLNTATDTVIAGTSEEIQVIQKLIERSGLKSLPLAIPFAFHSSGLDPMLDRYEELARKVSFNSPTIPVISPLLATCVSNGGTFNANYLRRSSREPVDFIGALKAAEQMGIINEKVVWLDIGPHPACQAFIQCNISAKKTFATLRRNDEDLSTIVKTMVGLHCKGFPILWNEYFAPHEKTYDLLHLDQYSWNLKNYWLPYKGTWTLDKAHEKTSILQNWNGPPTLSSPSAPLISSSIHRIVSDEYRDFRRYLITSSDIMRGDLWDAVHSHRIRDVEVASSSLWVDMAYTIAEYLYKDLVPEEEEFSMDLADFNVFHSTLARKDRSKPQLLRVESCLDFRTRSTTIEFYNISLEGAPLSDPYASATVHYVTSHAWKREWRMIEPFLNDHIENLSSKVQKGTANRFSKRMVYSLFKNIVEYDDMYQGIQSIVLDGLEAFSEITLHPDKLGDWLMPPHYIESVLSVAGFIMNCSDEFEHQETFAICPGWENLRFLRRLEPGEKLRCYVRMIPSKQHRSFFGDVVVMKEGKIIGMCTQMKFQRVPRLLMDNFFSSAGAKTVTAEPKAKNLSESQFSSKIQRPMTPSDSGISEDYHPSPTKLDNTIMAITDPFYSSSNILKGNFDYSEKKLAVREERNLVTDVINLIANETGLDLDDFKDESTFLELGVDSLTSLVLSQKFRTMMNIEVHNTIFLDLPTVKEFTNYLKENF
ncbi:Non-reducing polyketide synthase nscA [Erysiphe neolycopersici]|uniref:Non-reducing polyketide synthase nscA n=1 Tax=Erysiphe neolycopersici TaxID=212602 RepID=A0A420I0H9_9PEZI|nr:Non-reducing polyketide synthase nscA [Erysiphe neolycopersici]